MVEIIYLDGDDFEYNRKVEKLMMERIGRRSPEELTGLLERGYFVSGNQHITKEGVQDYRLWDDWENREYQQGLTVKGSSAHLDSNGK
jgi:hypothetical protein